MRQKDPQRGEKVRRGSAGHPADGTEPGELESVLHSFFDHLPIPAFSITPECDIRLCNATALALLGLTEPATLVGSPLAQKAYAPSCRKKAAQLFARWRRGGEIHGEELQVLSAAGETRDVLVFVDSISGGVRKQQYTLALHLDITERKTVERQLEAEQKRSRMYLDMAGVILLALDPDGVVTLVNPAGCRVLGAPAPDVVGRNWFESFVPPEEREHVRRAFAQLMSGLTENVEHVENRVLTADAGTRLVAWDNTVIRDDDGAILGTFSSGKDITEEHSAQIALEESERHYRELADSLPQVVFEVDTEGRLQFVNANAYSLFGYTHEEFQRGLSALEMIAPEDRERAAADIARSLRDGSQRGGEYVAQRKDGERFPVLIHSSRVARQGQVIGLRGLIIDLTEQKATEKALRESEERLRQSQKMEALGKLAGGIAHDFNNLLTSILGYSELLLSGQTLPEREREHVSEILGSARRAASLVGQLLAFSRKQILRPVRVDLNKLVADLSRMLRRLIHENITLDTQLDPSTGPIEADPAQLEQVIINLATNARDAMPSGGSLTFATRPVSLGAADRRPLADMKPGRYALLTVSDTGHGMDEATMARLFEPFFTTKGVGQGTGLGLASVFGTVKQTGGHICVDSSPGSGSTFSIYLPERPAATEPSGAGRDAAGDAGSGEIVLLVEDDEAVRTMTATILEQAGYRVRAAANGRAARELLDSGDLPRVDLLITDMVMPEMGGRQLAAEAKSRHPRLAVLYISGYSEEAELLSDDPEFRAGFIEKPFTPAALKKRVREALSAR
jgi:two-component system cell cycle sensor histidine kinase/response regulator CckA